MSIGKAHLKIHPHSAQVARKYAREKLGIQSPKLRAPTSDEAIEGHKKAHFDTNQVRDTVVIQDKKGQEILLMLDVDPKASRHNNVESALLTASGMVPIVGAPLVAAFAIKDLVKGGLSISAAKAVGQASDPAARATFRMGLKHLGLSSLSMATGGVGNAIAASAEVAGAAHVLAGAHQVVVGAEVVSASHDSINAHKHEDDRKSPFKAVFTALKSLFGVHTHHEKKISDARVMTLQHTCAEGNVTKDPKLAEPKRMNIEPIEGKSRFASMHARAALRT